jgi:prepilin-type N-terminal cleavage/methylation domain-containing protein
LRISARRRGFTLIELLIVVAIIGILATLLLSAIFGAKVRTQIGVAKSQIRAIQAALAMYEGDHGKFPRRAPRPTDASASSAGFDDDAPALYAALRNRATATLGGGTNSPYMDWNGDATGLLQKNFCAAGTMSGNTYPDHGVQALSEEMQQDVNRAEFQQQYLVSGAGPFLVFLDPWGNPYHYREWASVRTTVKDAIMAATITRTVTPPPLSDRVGQAPVAAITDGCHSPEAFDLWSNGPNGINEYGAAGSDDVTSWSR